MIGSAVIVRPDGRVYRPRKPGMRAHAWQSEDDQGVVVFGTLDAVAAAGFALESAVYWYGGGGEVGEPRTGWWRDGFLWGERRWIDDEKRGAPGVMFTWFDS